MNAEVSKDFQTGDLIILIRDGVKIRENMVTKIRITEELMDEHGKYLRSKKYLLDIDIP